ncbi:NADP-dependent oxidoreductase domain-containing protein [Phlebopus sp. FC_14]|nr:NADP-dependent oxidoreductase domain-containing protein [Phlebopus sp. FC_14]
MSVSTLTLNDGTQVPWIAFGTGTALYQQDASDSITLAIDNGFTHLDCAQMYGNEQSVGKGIIASGKPRSELYITTKLNRLSPGQTAKTALQESVRKLGVEHVDLYLIHSPSAHAGRLQQILKGATIPPAVNQLEIHPYVWKSLQPVIACHKEHNIVSSSYGGLSPLFRAQGGPVDPVIKQVRARLEQTRASPVSEAQVLNKWLQQKDILVVTTSSKADRIREYLDTQNVPELSVEEVELIETAGAQLHKKFF